MKHLHLFENEENFFYVVVQSEYLISTLGYCAKSERTFDIRYKDLEKNLALQNVLELNYVGDFASYLSAIGDNGYKKKLALLRTNPTLRLLVQNDDLFISVLSILSPGDIRVAVNKYNL